MASFSDWLSNTPFSLLIQTHFWAIPSLQIVHILCLATLFAASLMLTLKVLGRGWGTHSAGNVADRFVPVIWTCLAILLVTGLLLITAEPGRTLSNWTFYLKMTLLAVAILLTLGVGGAARRNAVTATHRGMAVTCMLVWVGIMIAGRYIAYTD